MKTFEQLFSELPYSEIDIKLEISQGQSGLEVGYVVEGCDEWGYKNHLSSGITDKVKLALNMAREDLESKIGAIYEKS